METRLREEVGARDPLTASQIFRCLNAFLVHHPKNNRKQGAPLFLPRLPLDNLIPPETSLRRYIFRPVLVPMNCCKLAMLGLGLVCWRGAGKVKSAAFALQLIGGAY